MENRIRWWRRRAFDVVVAALIFVLVAEIAARVVPWTPRVQIVDPDAERVVISEVDGVPLWHRPTEPGFVRAKDCADGMVHVALASDSILDVSDRRSFWEGRVIHRLRAQLRPKACVINVSAPAYVARQEVTAVQMAHARHGIDVAVVVVWNAGLGYVRAGGAWWALAEEQRVGGGPVPPIPVPLPVHHGLLEVSKAWQLLTQAWLPVPDVLDEAEAFSELLRWGDAEGIRFVFVQGTPLDRPLSETAELQRAVDTGWAADLRRDAEARGHVFVRLSELLQDADHEAIRLDPCCHYNGEGHALIAEALGPVVEAEVDAVIAAREAPATP